METLHTNKKIALEIISPERLVLQETVDYVVLPAVLGPCAILPGHADFLTQLSIGEMRVVKDGQAQELALSGGFAQVENGIVKVFAETAELSKEIDAERARLAAQRAKEKLLQKDLKPIDIDVIEAELNRALLRLRVVGKIRKKIVK